MTQRIYIKSAFFIEKIILRWVVAVLVVADIFFSSYIPENIRPTCEIIISFIYFILFFFTSLCLFFEEESSFLTLIDINENSTKKETFVHFLKSKEELTKMSNISNYFLVFLILYVAQSHLNHLKSIGVVLFILITVVGIIFCLRILIWDGVERKKIISAIVIGQIILIYLLFTWGKNSYIRNYGDEIIGSNFEKPEYRTQYYVNIFPKKEQSKNYRLKADIHVYSESEESEGDEDRFGQEHTNINTTKYIKIEQVYWLNGGILTFDECELEIGKKILCTDSDEKDWYIELTNQKVK